MVILWLPELGTVTTITINYLPICLSRIELQLLSFFWRTAYPPQLIIQSLLGVVWRLHLFAMSVHFRQHFQPTSVCHIQQSKPKQPFLLRCTHYTWGGLKEWHKSKVRCIMHGRQLPSSICGFLVRSKQKHYKQRSEAYTFRDLPLNSYRSHTVRRSSKTKEH